MQSIPHFQMQGFRHEETRWLAVLFATFAVDAREPVIVCDEEAWIVVLDEFRAGEGLHVAVAKGEVTGIAVADISQEAFGGTSEAFRHGDVGIAV